MVAEEEVRSGLILVILKGKSTRCHLRLEMGIFVSNAAIAKHHTLGCFKQLKLIVL